MLYFLQIVECKQRKRQNCSIIIVWTAKRELKKHWSSPSIAKTDRSKEQSRILKLPESEEAKLLETGAREEEKEWVRLRRADIIRVIDMFGGVCQLRSRCSTKLLLICGDLLSYWIGHFRNYHFCKWIKPDQFNLVGI